MKMDMISYEKRKSGELYVATLDEVPEELRRKLFECKEYLYDFNHSRPKEVEYREEILQKVLQKLVSTVTLNRL